MTQVLTVSAANDFLDQAKGLTDLNAAGVAAADTAIQFLNSGSEVLAIGNNSGGNLTVTVAGVPDPYGRTTNEVIIIPTAKVGFISFANPAMFNSGGAVNITLSTSTSVQLALLRLRKNR